MGDCFILRRGGGGAGLNFEVVGGTTQPTNPKENTIWVNTDTDITGWVFSVDEPETPVEGMVWVTTASSSTAPINVAKKNTVMLYPQTAQQYISGVWVSLNASVYAGGKWVSLWNGFLFDFGDQYEVITGGWETRTDSGASAAIGQHINLGGSDGRWAYAGTVKKVSVDGYSKLTIKIISPGGAYTGHFIYLSNGPVSSIDQVARFGVNYKSGTYEYSFDISSLTGEYYVVLQCGNNAWIEHQRIYFER